MELRVLKYFLTTAEFGNITKAAEVAFTTQPNISKQIADLETELGKKLFVREKGRLRLTDEGIFFKKRAEEIVELSNRAVNEISAMGNHISGTVHIGAAETGLMRQVSQSIKALRSKNPGINFNIFSGSTVEVSDALEKGLLDFGILVAPFDTARWEYFEFPVRDTFGVLMRKDCPLAKKKAVTPKDMRGRPLIVAHQQLETNGISLWLGADIKTQNVVSTFNLITTPAMMVESGLGYAFTFDKLVYTGEGSPLAFRPLNPPLKASLFIVWKKNALLSKAAAEFLETVKARMG